MIKLAHNTREVAKMFPQIISTGRVVSLRLFGISVRNDKTLISNKSFNSFLY